MRAYTRMLVAAVVAPMDEEVAAMAEAISETADRQGNGALGKLTGLMVEARRLVLVSMIPGRQQIGAGSTYSGSGASGCRGDALDGDWSEFWNNSFRAAVLKDYN